MANVSRYTFDDKKHYVNVRLQQGVPLVDADWNEMDDIRKYEFEKFLAKFIGNGVPSYDDFRIMSLNVGGEDNFAINKGYCLVNGQIVVNEEEIKYLEQQLQLPELRAPQNNTRIDTVYLDVWEREINSDEDKNLKLKYAGSELETCVRIKREWVVRVVEGVEGSGEAANLPRVPEGHNFYILATLIRNKSLKEIHPRDIIDQRFVGMNLENSIRSVDFSRIQKVPLLQQTLLGTVPTASVGLGNPGGIAFDGKYIWVSNSGSDKVGKLSKIDVINNLKIADVSLGTFPEGSPMGVAFDGTHIWVANEGMNTVSKVNVKTNLKEANDVSLTKPYGVAFDGEYMWITNIGMDTISKVNIKTHLKEDIKGGAVHGGIAFDGTHIWVAHDWETISKIDVKKNKKVAEVSVNDPRGIAFDGTHIWVTNFEFGTVSKIDIFSDKIVACVGVGSYPMDIAFDGTHIWVSNWGTDPSYRVGTVSKIDVTRNLKVADIPVGEGPWSIAFDGTHIWVANTESHNIMKIKK